MVSAATMKIVLRARAERLRKKGGQSNELRARRLEKTASQAGSLSQAQATRKVQASQAKVLATDSTVKSITPTKPVITTQTSTQTIRQQQTMDAPKVQLEPTKTPVNVPTTTFGGVDVAQLQMQRAQEFTRSGPTLMNEKRFLEEEKRKKESIEFREDARIGFERLKAKGGAQKVLGVAAEGVAEFGGFQARDFLKSPKSQEVIAKGKNIFEGSLLDKGIKYLFQEDSTTKQRELKITGRGQFLSGTTILEQGTSRYQRAEKATSEFLAPVTEGLKYEEGFVENQTGSYKVATSIVSGAFKQVREKPLTLGTQVAVGAGLGFAGGTLFSGLSSVKGAATLSKVGTGVFIAGSTASFTTTALTQGKQAALEGVGRNLASFGAFTAGGALGFKGALAAKRIRTNFRVDQDFVKVGKADTVVTSKLTGRIKGVKAKGTSTKTGLGESSNIRFGGKKGVKVESFTKKGVTKTTIKETKTGKVLDEFIKKSPKGKPLKLKTVQKSPVVIKKGSELLKETPFRARQKTQSVKITPGEKITTGSGVYTEKTLLRKYKVSGPNVGKVGKALLRSKKGSLAGIRSDELIPSVRDVTPFGRVVEPTRALTTPKPTTFTKRVARFKVGPSDFNLNQISEKVLLLQTPKLNVAFKGIEGSKVLVDGIGGVQNIFQAQALTGPTDSTQSILEATAKPLTVSPATSGSGTRSYPRSTVQSFLTPQIKTPTIDIPNIPPPPIVPLFPVGFGLPFGGDASKFGFKRRGKKKVSKRIVTPTLFSAALQKFGKPTKGGVGSGLGLRLLQKKKKKKRRGLIAI